MTRGGFISFITIKGVATEEKLTDIASDAMAYSESATRMHIYKLSNVKHEVIEDDKSLSILNCTVKNISGHRIKMIFESQRNCFI